MFVCNLGRYPNKHLFRCVYTIESPIEQLSYLKYQSQNNSQNKHADSVEY